MNRVCTGLMAGAYDGVPLYVSDYCCTHEPIELSRWGRFCAWLEDRARAAELHWPWPHVQRERLVPQAVIVRSVLGWPSHIYLHPLAFDELIDTFDTFNAHVAAWSP